MPPRLTLKYLPLSEVVSEPEDGHWDIWAKRWWIHQPGQGLIFYGPSPQCNRNRGMVHNLQERLYPDAEVIFVERVCIPHNCRDYHE